MGKGVYERSFEQKAVLRRRFQEQSIIGAERRRGIPLCDSIKKKISLTKQGKFLSEDHKQKIAAGIARRCWKQPTSLEYGLQLLLESAELEYEAQVRFGRYVVDFWVPSHGLVFEADGIFWHQDKEREVLRDSYLQKRGIIEVVHLDDEDLELWREA